MSSPREARGGVEILRRARPKSEQQLDRHAALDQEQWFIVLVACMAHECGRESDVAELPACALLKLLYPA